MQKSIKELVRELAGRHADKLTLSELLSSKQFTAEAENAVYLLTRKQIKVVTTAAGKEGTAYTDGDRIVVEVKNNPIINYFTNIRTAFQAAMGVILHEVGHILYTDFDMFHDAIDKLLNGHIPAGDVLGEEADQLRKSLQNERTRKVIVTLYHAILNVVLDPHDEGKMINNHGPFVKRSIETLQEALRSRARPLEHQTDCDAFAALMNLSLYYARFKELPVLTHEYAAQNEYVQALKSAMPWFDKAVTTDDETVRYDAINHIVMLYLPLIVRKQEEHDQQASGSEESVKGSSEEKNSTDDSTEKSSGGPSDNGTSGQRKPSTGDPEQSESKKEQSDTEPPQLSEEESKKLIDSIKQAASAVGSAEIDPEAGKKLASGIAGCGKQDVSDGFNRVQMEAAEEMVYDHLSDLIDREVLQEIQNCPMHGLDEKPEIVADIVSPTLEGERRYEADYEYVKPYIRQVIKRVARVLQDLEDGGIDKNLPYGKSVMPDRSYRRDGKYFANRNVPSDIPEVAISVLIDNSGSMEHERIENAKRAALLLYLVAKEMRIPISVCFHNTGLDYQVRYHVAVDYEDRNTDSAVRIESRRPTGCNHDGAALRISAERLLKRPEEIKLLFLISDGIPNCGSYRDEVASNDLRTIVRQYKKQGIEFFAACMGQDKENILRIYQEDSIEIDDPVKLPKIFSKILSRKLLDR